MYRFRLQRVLEYRQRREEERTDLLRQAQLLHQQETAQLAALQAEVQAQEEQLAGAQEVTLAELQSWQRYHQVLAQRLAAQQRLVEQAAHIVREQRQQLLAARQETRMVETLRDQARQRYVLERAGREQQWLDDLALTRARHER